MLPRLILLIANLYVGTKAQSSLTPSDCIASISSFPNCDSTNSILDRFSSCKSEFRQCGLTTSFDSEFDQYLVDWHDACDQYLSISITTPPVTQLTATLEQGVCESIYQSCDRWSRGYASCTATQSGGPELTSCRCATTLLSQASVCEIDGAQSCLQSSADITNLWEYRNCPGASTIFVQGAATTEDASQTQSTVTSPPAIGPSVTPIF
ncbi:hypothetical protein K458DRAFT_374656, partial [Lentithecium fluviatile CBS 122367]